MIFISKLTNKITLRLRFRMSDFVRIDPSELPSQLTPSLQHLLDNSQGKQPLRIDQLNEYLKQPYRSHTLLQKIMKGYLKEAKDQDIEKMCKSVIQNDKLSPQKYYLDVVVNYYQDNIEQLLKWQDANTNPLPVLIILSAMTNPPKKQVSKYIRQLTLSSPLLKLYAYSILCRMDIMSVQMESEIYELSESITKSQYSEEYLNLVVEVTKLREFYTIFSAKTLDNFVKYLEKYCLKLPLEINKEIMRELSAINPSKVGVFQPFIRQMEKLATKNTEDEAQRDLQQKTLFLLDKHKMPSEYLLKRLLQEPSKWLHLAGQDPHLIMYLARQTNLPKQFIQNKLPVIIQQLLRMSQKPPMMVQRNEQIRLQICFKLLLSLNRDLTPEQVQTIEKLNFEAWMKYNKIELKTLRIIFTLFCQLKLNPDKYVRQIDRLLTPTDVGAVSEVWYNIYRLNMKYKMKVRIDDMQIIGIVEPEILSKLFYCINHKKPSNVDKLLDKCESAVEANLKNQNQHLKTILLILKVYAENHKDSYKFVYVKLEKALMAHFTKIKPADGDIAYVKKYFQMANSGSRKFHDFLSEFQSNPSSLKKIQKTYVEREKKFDELRENQRVDKIRVKRVDSMNQKKQKWKQDGSGQKPAF